MPFYTVDIYHFDRPDWIMGIFYLKRGTVMLYKNTFMKEKTTRTGKRHL